MTANNSQGNSSQSWYQQLVGSVDDSDTPDQVNPMRPLEGNKKIYEREASKMRALNSMTVIDNKNYKTKNGGKY